MDLSFSEEFCLLRDEIERIVEDYSDISTTKPAYFVTSDRLERLIEDGGWFAVAESGYGIAGAVLLIDAIGRVPFAVETVASAILAPVFGIRGVTRPIAVIDAARPGPVRFLKDGCSALVDAGDHVRLITRAVAEPVSSFLAFPFGKLTCDPIADSDRLDDVPIERFRQYRSIGIAAEIVSAMGRALDLTVDYSRQRVQFGKPIGAFQAVAHRLAECASLIDSARWLVRKAAAAEEPIDAPIALAYAQDAAERLIWETNQLHGAVALTLEYPLHYWNYRLRVLQGEMGGPSAALAQVASMQAARAKARDVPADDASIGAVANDVL